MAIGLDPPRDRIRLEHAKREERGEQGVLGRAEREDHVVRHKREERHGNERCHRPGEPVEPRADVGVDQRHGQHLQHAIHRKPGRRRPEQALADGHHAPAEQVRVHDRMMVVHIAAAEVVHADLVDRVVAVDAGECAQETDEPDREDDDPQGDEEFAGADCAVCGEPAGGGRSGGGGLVGNSLFGGDLIGGGCGRACFRARDPACRPGQPVDRYRDDRPQSRNRKDHARPCAGRCPSAHVREVQIAADHQASGKQCGDRSREPMRPAVDRAGETAAHYADHAVQDHGEDQQPGQPAGHTAERASAHRADASYLPGCLGGHSGGFLGGRHRIRRALGACRFADPDHARQRRGGHRRRCEAQGIGQWGQRFGGGSALMHGTSQISLRRWATLPAYPSGQSMSPGPGDRVARWRAGRHSECSAMAVLRHPEH